MTEAPADALAAVASLERIAENRLEHMKLLARRIEALSRENAELRERLMTAEARLK